MSRDTTCRSTRPFNRSFHDRLPLSSKAAWLILECARRTRHFQGRALHEHRTNVSAVPLLLPSSLVALSPGGGLQLSSTARVERSPSNSLPLPQEERPRLPFTARIGRAQLHRARSASKKGTWPLLPAPLMGNTLQPLGSVDSVPRWNRPEPTIAASTACQSPTQRCTV